MPLRARTALRAISCTSPSTAHAYVTISPWPCIVVSIDTPAHEHNGATLHKVAAAYGMLRAKCYCKALSRTVALRVHLHCYRCSTVVLSLVLYNLHRCVEVVMRTTRQPKAPTGAAALPLFFLPIIMTSL